MGDSLTLLNFFLLGTASGFTLAAALAAWLAPALVMPCAAGQQRDPRE